MIDRPSPVLAEYLPAFADSQQPFVHAYSVDDRGAVRSRRLTRGEFWLLASRVAGGLRAAGIQPGERVLLCVSGNRLHDLALRLASIFVGAVPVTVNWQADTAERVIYKARLTDARLIVTDTTFAPDALALLQADLPYLPQLPIQRLADSRPLPPDEFCRDLTDDHTRIIIFTSGTTGQPKGVELSYRSYRTNRGTFEQFLDIAQDCQLALLVTNPLHHTNSTAMTDWALRRPATQVHLVERYTTAYWRLLADIAEGDVDRLVAPLVSRHFDYLDNLQQTDRLPVPLPRLREAMSRADLLLGSAPVGPSTVDRLLHFSGHLPVVRFGSTETCLQVMGIPRALPETVRMDAFKRGWEHELGGEPQAGYYIGRPHPPFTDVRLVRAIDPGQAGYLEDCPPGVPGYLLTRGDNLMTGYVNDADATRDAFRDGWYAALRDICFALPNPHDGILDYYWVSRDSNLLIRGGANYAYDQVNTELADFVVRQYGLAREQFDLAVVGLRIESEHEDACCVTIQLGTGVTGERREHLAGTFLVEAGKAVSKGARPNYLRLAAIPRNFKGAVQVPELRREFREHLGHANPNAPG